MAYPPQPPYDPNQPPPAGPPYPPQPYPQKAPYGYQQPGPPPKPVNPKLVFWTSAPGIISMLAIMGALVVILVAISNHLYGPASDNFKVNVTSCDTSGSESLTTATIGLSVKNLSKATRTATVKIEYRDSGGNRIDTDTAYVRNIAAGDTARTEESTLLDAPPSGALRCEVVGIS